MIDPEALNVQSGIHPNDVTNVVQMFTRSTSPGLHLSSISRRVSFVTMSTLMPSAVTTVSPGTADGHAMYRMTFFATCTMRSFPDGSRHSFLWRLACKSNLASSLSSRFLCNAIFFRALYSSTRCNSANLLEFCMFLFVLTLRVVVFFLFFACFGESSVD